MNLNLFLFTLFLPYVGILAQSGTDVKNLITQLFTTETYSKKVRPLADQTAVVNIGVEFVLNSIIDFDEQEESLTTAGYLRMTWSDEYLVWTPSTYGGLVILFLPQDDIWKPDISLRNSYKSFTGLGSKYLNVLVANTGDVLWEPFQVLKSTCDIDIRYFPFDTQTCNLKFTAWSYRKSEVELNLGSNGIHLNDYDKNAAWELLSTSSSEVNTDEAAVVFTIKLKRRPLYYLLNIVSPVVMLSLLNACTFILPISSGERASYSITVFLSLAVFLTIIASELPKNSTTVSFLGIYLMCMTALSTGLVVVCLFESRLAARDAYHPINGVYKAVYTIACVLRCKRLSKKKKKVEQEPPKSKEVNKSIDHRGSTTWSDIVTAIDFLFFWFCLLYTFLCTTIIGSLAINN